MRTSEHAVERDGRPAPCAPILELLILSPVRFIRDSVGRVLARDGAISVGKLCADVEDALAASEAAQPNLILLDVGSPDAEAAVARLRTARPSTRIVALGVTETEESVAFWAEAGADGYIPRHAALEDLPRLVLDIAYGRQPCSGPVAAGLLHRLAATAGRAKVQHSHASLTVREREVVRLIGVGLSNKEIARRLDIGLATTKSHVHNVLAKLHVQRRAEACDWLNRRSRGA